MDTYLLRLRNETQYLQLPPPIQQGYCIRYITNYDTLLFQRSSGRI